MLSVVAASVDTYKSPEAIPHYNILNVLHQQLRSDMLWSTSLSRCVAPSSRNILYLESRNHNQLLLGQSRLTCASNRLKGHCLRFLGKDAEGY
ncbi:unnamed protein product [Dibothriocephalus latus]|uniref:Uncharacterized protein n=1 Tax=Dibothriocephalus latus TaxID=60516 RepID=A0A3P7LZ70_DIBLA|nr:unnamed protein product [Dibothriocephalus latus]